MTSGTPFSRRALLAGAGGAALGTAIGSGPLASSASAAVVEPFPGSSLSQVSNPLVRQRADTQIYKHDDGYYYLMGSVPEYDRLALRRSKTLAGLATAPETVVWRRPTSGLMGGHIWAPEIHHFDDAWYIYFAAGDSDDVFRIRTYVLRCTKANPLTTQWELVPTTEGLPPGRLDTTNPTTGIPGSSFVLDSTVFEHRGTRYLLWAMREPGIVTNSNIYIAPLATPTTFAAKPARLSIPGRPRWDSPALPRNAAYPGYEWEMQGFRVNEGPAPTVRNGRLFVTYSAAATDARYKMGLLTVDSDADIMNPNNWTKSQTPIFETSEATSVYGPGHNQFTVDEAGNDVLIYHGRDYRDIVGDPLYDPNRHTRVQRLYWRNDGTPDLGIPVGNGPLPV